MRGEVGKKTSKKRWVIPHFYDVTWLIFETLCLVTFSIFSFSSENYQVMNYGIGGHISIHADSPGLPSLGDIDVGGW